MKRILPILFILAYVTARGQVYNNEWIDYSKTYYKFKVGATGLYRIGQATLASLGLGSAPAEQFQLWRHGRQVAIYTTVQTGPMGASDYIEFWGEMNDGKPDNILYRQPDYQLNDKWSLQTDTAAYFLTLNPSGGNFRLVPTNNNVSGNSLPAEPYFLHTAATYYRNKINNGRSELVGTSYTYSSSYDYGEGWSSSDMAANVSLTATYSNLAVYTGAGTPGSEIRVHAAGNAVNPRYFRVRVNGDSVAGATINYYDYAKVTGAVSTASIGAGTATVVITNRGVMPSDRMVVGMVELTYPRRFNFGGASNFVFELPANAAGNYLEISAFAYSGIPVMYDLTNGRRYEMDVTNPTLIKVVLEPSAVQRKLVLVNEAPSNIASITTMIQRNFVNYGLPANQGDFLIITNQVLTTASNGANPVDDYKNYRSSSQGGGYSAAVYMVDQLEDQFGLGIKRHPSSLRNFIRWARATYSLPIKNILLIGKGLTYTQFRSFESNADVEKLALVTTFGYPASDNLLTANPGSSLPLIPIGRISAINGDEVAAYLQKLQQYEQLYNLSSPIAADKSWMKNVVHVVGASDDFTSGVLLTALNNHATIIKDTLYGGTVHLFAKNSADAVQQLSSQRIADLFNTGIGLLTYFGHSSSSTMEFNLDNPQNYNNTGKYPVFVVMGCNAGNFYNFNAARFSTKETLSERYVLAPEKGSIAFLASTHLGIVHYLDIWNTQFYRALSTTDYGKTIGQILDAAANKVFGITTENDFYARFQVEQFTLHGDPALKLYTTPKADYVIEDAMVKVSPNFISIADNTFTVDASFLNIGKAVSDSITIRVERKYPNGTTEVVRSKRIKGPTYSDTLIYTGSIIASRDKGLNQVTISIDADGDVDESYETNNSVVKDIYIYEDEARPIYPYHFAIVNEQNIKLVASSANALAEPRDYIMEIDSTELFNSPLKVTRTTTSSGGVFEFVPGITFQDSTVYYWRVAPNPASGAPVWNKASFIYLASGQNGFNQSHLYQHLKSERERIALDSFTRGWSFGVRNNNVFLRNGVYPTTSDQGSFYTGTINDVEGLIGGGCGYNQLVINVIDPVTFKPWKNVPTQYGSQAPCGSDRLYNFMFYLTDTTWRGRAYRFLENIIPNGYIVIVRNNADPNPAGNTYPQVWKNDTTYWGSGNSLYHALVKQGFSALDSFHFPRSLILAYRKNVGSNPVTTWKYSTGIYDAIALNFNCTSPDTLGYLTSPLLGPAKGWQDLTWRGNSSEASAGDMVEIEVIGITAAGDENVLFSGIDVTQQDVDISSIDANQFPYIRLRMRNQDSKNFTPYQLKYWRVTYLPVPEGAIAPNIYFTGKDAVDVGEPANFGVAFKNISKVNFDSVLVKFSITDKNNYENIVPYRLKDLTTSSPGDTLHFDVTIPTESLPGKNMIFVEFNPNDDQPEQHHFNNFLFKNLYVKPDSLQPLLDVTFDGVHILNHDIVASRPNILIKLKDEAQWLALDDTSLVNVSVRYPDGSVRRFNFDNDTLRFTAAAPAPVTDNTASLDFKPHLLEDGDYELIVTGKDRSDNSAGNIEYRVKFQVINKPMISNVLNYPNPFTTSTAFVFTITGSEVPQNIRIQILTITGKIVREITKDELGPLHIGRNITEFKWDGTDQYGQQLANGIYLYRVLTNLNGKSLDKYKSEGDETDKYFNKGYGKMYLMR